jgi:tetraacyldisaccharide 4'-kinase
MNGFVAWLIKPRKDLSTWGRAIRAPFSILALLFGMLVRARAKLFEKGFLKSRKLPVPVVVVGNLSAGGTGKTPLAAWLVLRLLDAGKKPVVISRGYRGRAEGEVRVVSDGEKVQVSARDAGEEPVLLSEKLEGVPVVMGRDRHRAGMLALERFSPDCLILDDGFQHLALQRDMDIVLLDAGMPVQDDDLIPRGRLREPPSALARADLIVIARAKEEKPDMIEYLKTWNPDAPVFFMRYVPQDMEQKGKRALAFCGIGSPGYFFELCKEQGMELVDRVAFPDHHNYSMEDVKKLEKRAESLNADFLLTTEKDEIKLRGMQGLTLPVEVLKVEPDFFGKDDEFFNLVLKKIFS